MPSIDETIKTLVDEAVDTKIEKVLTGSNLTAIDDRKGPEKGGNKTKKPSYFKRVMNKVWNKSKKTKHTVTKQSSTNTNLKKNGTNNNYKQ
ncbi:MAG: hypothetical protein IC227_08540 [Enterococcus lacertideformus]|uniref:Uncharacterized protein n=1 Tax=Enterococcus lacertideformus TaxID=2771493 RepID=A0A931F8Z0_9ENTE|nr:hypothetical protein [Enterococcus lacertideformus]